LGRCDLTEPGRTPATVTAGEQAVEQVMGRSVHDDARQVLAADQIDVVDPKVGGHDLVAGRAMCSLPLDDYRLSTSQSVARREERAAVLQRGREDVGVLALLPRPQQVLVVGPLGVDQGAGRRQPRGLDVVEPSY